MCMNRREFLAMLAVLPGARRGERRARHNVVSPGPWETRESPVRRPAGLSLDQLKGRRIRLVFLLRDSRLFSFRAQERI